MAPGGSVREVLFAAGDEVLRPASAAIESTAFPNFFPEATDTLMVRRGRLSYPQGASNCVVLLESSESVRYQTQPTSL